MRNWPKRIEEMLLAEKATPAQVKQFYALSIRAQKLIVRNFDRKNKLQNDPHRVEKLKAAAERRKRRYERQAKGARKPGLDLSDPAVCENIIELQGITDVG
jgi:predicted DNA-binding WGR domain protein